MTMHKESGNSISATSADWSREKPRRWFDPSRRLLKHLRRYQMQRSKNNAIGRLASKWNVLWYRVWSVITGAEIAINGHIEGGLLLPHPNGVVIHCDAKIGPNCLIFQQVTIGTRGAGKGVPLLAGQVNVGAGAKILGGVTIGPHARIGANAVVLCDVPASAIAVGVPAKITLSELSSQIVGPVSRKKLQ